MTNNIEQIEDLILKLEKGYGTASGYIAALKQYKLLCFQSAQVIKSMQSQIDALKQEADEDESRESESL